MQPKADADDVADVVIGELHGYNLIRVISMVNMPNGLDTYLYPARLADSACQQQLETTPGPGNPPLIADFAHCSQKPQPNSPSPCKALSC